MRTKSKQVFELYDRSAVLRFSNSGGGRDKQVSVPNTKYGHLIGGNAERNQSIADGDHASLRDGEVRLSASRPVCVSTNENTSAAARLLFVRSKLLQRSPVPWLVDLRTIEVKEDHRLRGSGVSYNGRWLLLRTTDQDQEGDRAKGTEVHG